MICSTLQDNQTVCNLKHHAVLCMYYCDKIICIFIDHSQAALRHAMANVVAVVFGLPEQSNHIWYHIFQPDLLRDTYPTGFMVRLLKQYMGLISLYPTWVQYFTNVIIVL